MDTANMEVLVLLWSVPGGNTCGYKQMFSLVEEYENMALCPDLCKRFCDDFMGHSECQKFHSLQFWYTSGTFF